MRTAPGSVLEVHFDAGRRDARVRQFLERARDAGVRLIESDGIALARMCGNHAHQGVVARVSPLPKTHSLDQLLEALEAALGNAMSTSVTINWSVCCRAWAVASRWCAT